MQHLLTDVSSGQSTTLTCENLELVLETVKNGRGKTTRKTFPDEQEAIKQFLKKEWELLKKGAVMHTSTAVAGEALLHVYIGGGYTGCLSFVSTPHGIYVYRAAGVGKDFGAQDELLQISDDGFIEAVLTLPGVLPWQLDYDAKQNQLLIDLDHYIYTYDFSGDSFTQLTESLDQPASFSAVANGTRAYGTHPSYYISHGDHSDRISQPLSVQIIRGSIPICAALSTDGQILALHHEEHKIALLDTRSGTIIKTLSLDFEMAGAMEWTKDNRQLIVLDHYGRVPLQFFDVSTGEVAVFEDLGIPGYSQDISDFCLNNDNSLLVCSQRTKAFVFDFVRKKFLYSFLIQHCVKTSAIRFLDENRLGVRTDYGCFSIYPLR